SQVQAVHQAAQHYEPHMVGFLRELIAIPSESAREKAVIERIRAEMQAVGFDEVRVDGMGNLLGRIGNGKTVVAIDTHVDTVGIGNRDEWQRNPYAGALENGIIYGRGASDQKGPMASMVYAGRMIKELDLLDDYTLYIVASVQEEDCDGLCWQYLIREDGLRPDVVLISEPTNLNVYRGHRGRVEIEVTTRGKSCHASAPERGVNAVCNMVPIISEIQQLNERLAADPFLGKGTVAVTHIGCQTPSLNAIPPQCSIYLDRRLTLGEDKQTAVRQVEEAVQRSGMEAAVSVPTYRRPSYTGLVYPTEKYFPPWVLEEDHPAVQSAVDAYQTLFNAQPHVGRWVFSTNAVSITGMFAVPSVGFGPGDEIYAHTVDEQMPVEHLVKAAAFYASFPTHFVHGRKREARSGERTTGKWDLQRL
ncbi:MAG TPA: YgeY family selenium metabolism-linked hydrolase, partial [Candidatus Bipolaricaulota bacterium]